MAHWTMYICFLTKPYGKLSSSYLIAALRERYRHVLHCYSALRNNNILRDIGGFRVSPSVVRFTICPIL